MCGCHTQSAILFPVILTLDLSSAISKTPVQQFLSEPVCSFKVSATFSGFGSTVLKTRLLTIDRAEHLEGAARSVDANSWTQLAYKARKLLSFIVVAGDC